MLSKSTFLCYNFFGGFMDFVFKKKYGQNFLVDKNVINKIVQSIDCDKDTLVVEVGPGGGALTEVISPLVKNVLAYEIDISLKEKLDIVCNNNSNVKIIYQDFLKVNLLEDLKSYSYDKVYFLSNLPYYITTPILERLLFSNIIFDKMFIMVQKEAGDRLSSSVGSREYNAINVISAYHYSIKKIINIGRNSFYPIPNVDSVILSYSKKDRALKVNDYSLFLRIVNDSFRQKRKNLRNNLRNYDLDKIESVLLRNNFSLNSRAEEIPVEIFIEITNEL